MTGYRAAAGAVVDRVIRVAGRRQVVRAARFVLYRAKLDAPNAMASNGEALLQAAVLGAAARSGSLRVFDVGANEGEWSRSLLDEQRRSRPDVALEVHCFEPSSFTVGRLRQALADPRVTINQVALSDRAGTASLQVDGDGAGSNTLHERRGHGADTETVDLTTLDRYCAGQGIEAIDLVKIDTEGHDYSVLKGGRAMLASQSIAVVQFEYNHRWIGARRYLRDAFDLLEPLGYQLGKVTPRGIEVYPGGWDWELESFVEGNYVAFLPAAGPRLPERITWWKEA